MSSDQPVTQQDVSPVEPDPQARFRLDGGDGSRLELNACPLHPGGVEFLLHDGISTAVVELEIGDGQAELDEVQAVISALAQAHQAAVARREASRG